MLIDLVKNFFPCFIEFLLLYFYHFFVACYYFLFNQRLLEHCLEKTLCFRQNTIFLIQDDKNITNFLIRVTKLPFLSVINYFVSYRVFSCKSGALNDNFHKILHRYNFFITSIVTFSKGPVISN